MLILATIVGMAYIEEISIPGTLDAIWRRITARTNDCAARVYIETVS